MARVWVGGLAAVAFILLPLAWVPPAAALTGLSACGSVSDNSILTADVTSTGTCFTVTANDVHLDLNGHSITNTTSAVATTPCGTKNYQGQGTTADGINTNGHSNVHISGPGTISGYHVGVFINGGSNVHVGGLLITGPAAFLTGGSTSKPFVGCNPRPASAGIEAVGTDGVDIHDTTVENHTEGMHLVNVMLGNIGHNRARRNNSDPNECHGILAQDTKHVNFNNNEVTLNGEDLGIDGGLTLRGALSSENQLVGNRVINNFGDGISLRFGAHDNMVVNNTALGNPAAPSFIAFFDLAQRSAGANNNFVNNTFGTKNF